MWLQNSKKFAAFSIALRKVILSLNYTNLVDGRKVMAYLLFMSLYRSPKLLIFALVNPVKLNKKVGFAMIMNKLLVLLSCLIL